MIVNYGFQCDWYPLLCLLSDLWWTETLHSFPKRQKPYNSELKAKGIRIMSFTVYVYCQILLYLWVSLLLSLGFSNKLIFGQGSSNRGNKVQLLSSDRTRSYACDVNPYSSHKSQIQCLTRYEVLSFSLLHPNQDILCHSVSGFIMLTRHRHGGRGVVKAIVQLHDLDDRTQAHTPTRTHTHTHTDRM